MAKSPDFSPYPHLERPFEAWRRERWLPPAATPPPDLEVHGPPAIDPEELPGLLAEAREAGAAQALEGIQEELETLRAMALQMGPALDELARLRHTTLVAAAEDVADIVRVFATKLVGESLALHPEALPKLVRDALAQLPDSDDVTIACSPQAAESLSRYLEPALRDRLVVDPEIGGGVIVRTRNASLDATLRHAEAALETAIQGWLAEQWWVDGPG